MLDLYVQFVLKQGQIEVEAQPAELPPSDYRNTNVELIHRREVENLNKSIIVKFTTPSFSACSSLIRFFLPGIRQLENSSDGQIETCL